MFKSDYYRCSKKLVLKRKLWFYKEKSLKSSYWMNCFDRLEILSSWIFLTIENFSNFSLFAKLFHIVESYFYSWKTFSYLSTCGFSSFLSSFSGFLWSLGLPVPQVAQLDKPHNSENSSGLIPLSNRYSFPINKFNF